MPIRPILFALLPCAITFLALPAQAQKTVQNPPAREESAPAKPKGLMSVFKKADDSAASSPSSDLKATHKDAQKEVRVAKKERKAAEAREEAARARAEAIKAQKRAANTEQRSGKAEERAEKARQKVGRQGS